MAAYAGWTQEPESSARWPAVAPRALGGMLAPIFAPLVSDGVGLMRYGADGVVPLFPRTVYTALSLIAVVGLLVLLWRRPKSLSGAPLAWPFLPLYFAWRSLQNYFASAPLFALVSDEELENDQGAPPAEDGPRSSPAPVEARRPRT